MGIPKEHGTTITKLIIAKQNNKQNKIGIHWCTIEIDWNGGVSRRGLIYSANSTQQYESIYIIVDA